VTAVNTQTNRIFTVQMREHRYGACVAGYTKSSSLTRTSLKDMKNKPDSADLSLSETMAARIEVNDAKDPAHQKK
jgi:hypothetical protein